MLDADAGLGRSFIVARTLWAVPDTTGDPRVDAELADLAKSAPKIADAARAGFQSLTWGEGLGVVTLHSLASFLWYQLPVKWLVDLEEKLAVIVRANQEMEKFHRGRAAATPTA